MSTGGVSRRGTLLVASTGGHLKELCELRPRLDISEPVRWATFEHEQSHWLLDGETVDYVAHTAPRDLRNVLRNSRAAAEILRLHRPEQVISTGAALALSFLPIARAMGARCHYIESAARSDGPSLSGRLLACVPGILLYSQYPSWARHRWRFSGSVFDAFEGLQASTKGPLTKVVVTVGTMAFGFRRLVDRLVELLGPEVDVLWQIGPTDVGDLPIRAHASVGHRELEAAMRQADLVVAHAGIGSALGALEAGLCPVLVPRSRAAGEHVDDHQALIAQELDRRGLAIAASVEELTRSHLEEAAGRRVARTSAAAPFHLA